MWTGVVTLGRVTLTLTHLLHLLCSSFWSRNTPTTALVCDSVGCLCHDQEGYNGFFQWLCESDSKWKQNQAATVCSPESSLWDAPVFPPFDGLNGGWAVRKEPAAGVNHWWPHSDVIPSSSPFLPQGKSTKYSTHTGHGECCCHYQTCSHNFFKL